jgi:hypothetical protein
VDLKHAGPDGEVRSEQVQCESREIGLKGGEEDSTKYKMLGKRKK